MPHTRPRTLPATDPAALHLCNCSPLRRHCPTSSTSSGKLRSHRRSASECHGVNLLLLSGTLSLLSYSMLCAAGCCGRGWEAASQAYAICTKQTLHHMPRLDLMQLPPYAHANPCPHAFLSCPAGLCQAPAHKWWDYLAQAPKGSSLFQKTQARQPHRRLKPTWLLHVPICHPTLATVNEFPPFRNLYP